MAYTNTVWDAASREYNAEIVVYNSSGTAQEDSFVNEIESFSLKRSMADSSSIAMASATASSLSLRLKNVTLAKLNTLRNNAYFRLKITCNSGNSGLTSGLGFYFIDKLEHKRRNNDNYDVSLNCYDLFFKTEKTYTPSSSISSATTVTARMIVADIISQLTGRTYNVSLADSTWATTTIEAIPQDTSMRVMLSYMAGLNGSCAVTKEDGNFPSFTAIWYTDSGKLVSLSEQYQDGCVFTTDSEVKVTSLTSGTDENPITVPDNSGVGLNLSFANPYMTETLLNNIATDKAIRYIPSENASTTAIKFQPMNIKWRGNALIDIGKTMAVENPHTEKVYYFVCDTSRDTYRKICVPMGDAPTSSSGYPSGTKIVVKFAERSKNSSSSTTSLQLRLETESGGTIVAARNIKNVNGGNVTGNTDLLGWQNDEIVTFVLNGSPSSTSSTWNIQSETSSAYRNCYVMEKTINYDGGYYEEISCLGDTTQSVSFKTNPLGKINRKMNAMEAAILEATQIIGDVEDMQSGVFTIIKDTQGTNNIGWKIESNSDNNYILANKNGIGFSSNGGQSFNAVALYIDDQGRGHINANNIVVENLTATQVDFTSVPSSFNSAVTSDVQTQINNGGITIGNGTITGMSGDLATILGGINSNVSGLDTSVSDVSKRTELYFTCSTSSSTADKTAVLQDSGTIPTITYGTRIIVKFSNQSKMSDSSETYIRLKLTDSSNNVLRALTRIDAGNGLGRVQGKNEVWSANSIVCFVLAQISGEDRWVIQADYNAQQAASTAQTTATNAANAAANAQATIASWAYGTDTTYIDGAKIYTGTITAAQINLGWQAGNLASSSQWTNPTYNDTDYLAVVTDSSGNIKGYAKQNFGSGVSKTVYSAPFYVASGAHFRMSATFSNTVASASSQRLMQIILKASTTIDGSYSTAISGTSFIDNTPNNSSIDFDYISSDGKGRFFKLEMSGHGLNVNDNATNIFVTYTITGNMVVTGKIKSANSNGENYFDLDYGIFQSYGETVFSSSTKALKAVRMYSGGFEFWGQRPSESSMVKFGAINATMGASTNDKNSLNFLYNPSVCSGLVFGSSSDLSSNISTYLVIGNEAVYTPKQIWTSHSNASSGSETDAVKAEEINGTNVYSVSLGFGYNGYYRRPRIRFTHESKTNYLWMDSYGNFYFTGTDTALKLPGSIELSGYSGKSLWVSNGHLMWGTDQII